jgi:hypothetical protein
VVNTLEADHHLSDHGGKQNGYRLQASGKGKMGKGIKEEMDKWERIKDKGKRQKLKKAEG